MTSEPVWEQRRVNYQAVPTNDEREDSCENPNSWRDELPQIALANEKPSLVKGKRRIDNDGKFNSSRIETEQHDTIQNMAASENYNRVVINVSGMRFETYDSTSARLSDSLLGSHTKRAPYYRSTSNELYFNRNRNVFESILFYYQSGATGGGILVKPDGIPDETFEVDVKFFELGHDAERKIGLETDRKEHGRFEVVLGVMSNCQNCSSKIGNLFEPNRTNNTSPLHRVIDVWTIFITVYFIVLLCVKTFPSIRQALTFDQCNNDTEQSTTAKNWFTLEYIIRAFSAFDKTAYLISAQGTFDLLSFLPYIIQIILQESISATETIVLQRILVFLMFLSVFKLTRYSVGLQILLKTIQTSVKELTLLLVCVVISLVLFSSVVYYFEISDQSTTFTSIPETFWFIIVTMTTVGYGDMTPTTVAGKLLALFARCLEFAAF